jgi:flagellar hook-length control protein FliK
MISFPELRTTSQTPLAEHALSATDPITALPTDKGRPQLSFEQILSQLNTDQLQALEDIRPEEGVEKLEGDDDLSVSENDFLDSPTTPIEEIQQPDQDPTMQPNVEGPPFILINHMPQKVPKPTIEATSPRMLGNDAVPSVDAFEKVSAKPLEKYAMVPIRQRVLSIPRTLATAQPKTNYLRDQSASPRPNAPLEAKGGQDPSPLVTSSMSKLDSLPIFEDSSNDQLTRLEMSLLRYAERSEKDDVLRSPSPIPAAAKMLDNKSSEKITLNMNQSALGMMSESEIYPLIGEIEFSRNASEFSNSETRVAPVHVSSLTSNPTSQPVGRFSLHNSKVISDAVLALRDSGGQIDVILSPEDLGRLNIKLEQTVNGTQITFAVEKLETQDLMRRQIEHLQSQFKNMGFENLSFDFEQQHGNTTEQKSTEKNDALNDGLPPKQDQKPLQLVATTGGLDIRI